MLFMNDILELLSVNLRTMGDTEGRASSKSDSSHSKLSRWKLLRNRAVAGNSFRFLAFLGLFRVCKMQKYNMYSYKFSMKFKILSFHIKMGPTLLLFCTAMSTSGLHCCRPI